MIFSYLSQGIIIIDFIVVRATEGEIGLKNSILNIVVQAHGGVRFNAKSASIPS